MSDIRTPQNPGIGGLDELTLAEEIAVQQIASIGDSGVNYVLGYDTTDNSFAAFLIGTGLAYDHATHTLSSTGGAGLDLEVEGVANTDQTLLNLVAGTNMNITDNGDGSVTFDASGGGSTITFGADNQIPYTNGTTDDFDYTAGFTFDGTNFAVPGDMTVGDDLDVVGTLTTNNFIPSAIQIGTDLNVTSAAEAQILGSTTMRYNLRNGILSITPDADESVFVYLMPESSFTEAASGTHAVIGGIGIRAPDITSGVGATTNAVTLYIDGAPTGTATPTNVYAVWVDDGVVRIDGNLSLGSAPTPQSSDGAALGSSSLMWSDLFLASGGVINFNAGNLTLTHSAGVLTANGQIIATSLGVSSTTIPAVGIYAPSAGVLGMAVGSAGEVQLTSTALSPMSSDGTALGTTALMWSDLFLASGSVINFNNGDITVTHSANTLTFAGASSGYIYDAVNRPSANDGAALGTAAASWSDLFLASGGVINFANGNATLTHSSGLITSSVPVSLGTSNAFTTGTIELGHATANTLSASGGVLSIEGVVIPTVSSTSTLTNKIISHVVEPGTDDTYTGDVITGILAGDTIAQWDLVYHDVTSGRWELADADAATTAGSVLVGLAVASGTDGGALTVLVRGMVRNDGWTWTVGALFASTTPGGMTLTAPSATDDVNRVLGYAVSDDCVWFDPAKTWITRV